MDDLAQTFDPLVTELHRTAEHQLSLGGDLPSGLLRLQEAGREAWKSLVGAGVLGVVSLALLGILLLTPPPGAIVVWQEEYESAPTVYSELP